MNPPPDVDVHPDADALAQAVADQIAARLSEVQAGTRGTATRSRTGGTASIVLTGGRTANMTYQALGVSQRRDEVDWRRVDVWWGDERFLPPGHPDRNETQARAALLDALPLDPARVHPMPAAPAGADPQAAADRYAERLPSSFDLLLLSLGEDGHVASLFPGHPAVRATTPVAVVRDSPKPPPVRLTLTLPTLCSAAEVWLLATGAAKAAAVSAALADLSPGRSGSEPAGALAARIRGRERTRWLLDQYAGSALRHQA